MRPFPLIAAALIGVPLLEIYLFIKVGGVIGASPTIVLTVLTAVIGAMLVRAQGTAALRRAQASLRRDEMPARELLEAAALLVGGVLLVIPGFFTDAIGFLILWPASRAFLLSRLLPRMRIVAVHNVNRSANRVNGPARGPTAGTGRVIEGESRHKPND